MSNSKRAAEIADALDFISDANLGGTTGDEHDEEMRLLVETYFVSPSTESFCILNQGLLTKLDNPSMKNKSRSRWLL